MYARDVPLEEIARQCGVPVTTVSNWVYSPEGKDHVERIRIGVAEATKELAVSDKSRRIRMAQVEADRILELIQERRTAAAGASDPLPGELSGLVAVKETTTTIGSGNNIRTTTVREGKYDAAVHEQLRRLLEYVAREKGELDIGLNVKHSGRVDHVVRRQDLDRLSDEQLEQLTVMSELLEIDAQFTEKEER